MILSKEKAGIIGKCLEKRGLKREERYIQTQIDTRKRTSKNNDKVVREPGDRVRRGIYSDTE
jgi:hypothetical protein